MILSSYSNPPYRSPLRMNSSSPPQSPKRKRNDDSDSLPEVNNVKATAEMQNEHSQGASSPRMRVAEKLSDLNLRSVKPARLFTKAQSAPRKRLKKSVLSTPQPIVEIPFRSNKNLSDPYECPGEIGETPDCRSKEADLPSSSLVSTKDPEVTSNKPQVIGGNIEVANPASSPPMHVEGESDPLESPVVDPLNRSVSPLPVREDLSADQAALTWQEDEITGHEIDAAAEDDGEGINGIGFKPTPAIAYARQQKRKQQVNEYKTREAREARQKRLQRRRGASVEVVAVHQESGDDETKRMVRFAGVG